ncbi:hypothetical protein TGRUB_313422 [Toxoplasma gondii RUB]|uniref:Uncharacterized protein n=2 Tax=Toxoplasma gondii TaxID=5811 RepID=A0A086MB50_TOXGO|nr:hypothetical protein TGRUB_313422 [Toxoplasma gondii RUB]
MQELSPFLPSSDRTSCMLILVYGLPASGKTTLCRALSTSPLFAENLSRAFGEPCGVGIEGKLGDTERHLCPRHVFIQHICFDALERDLLRAQKEIEQLPRPVETKRETGTDDLPSGSPFSYAVCSDACPSSSLADVSSSPSSSSSPSTSYPCPSEFSPRSAFVASQRGRQAGTRGDCGGCMRRSEIRSASHSLSRSKPPSEAEGTGECACVREGEKDATSFDPATWKRARHIAHGRIRDILERREVWYRRQAGACGEERNAEEGRGESEQQTNEIGGEQEEPGGKTEERRERRRQLRERRAEVPRRSFEQAECTSVLPEVTGSLRTRTVGKSDGDGDQGRREESRGRICRSSPFSESPSAFLPPSALDAVASSPLLVLLVDDTMHLASMRKKLFRLASQYHCAFHQVYLDTPLHHCLGRNEARFSSRSACETAGQAGKAGAEKVEEKNEARGNLSEELVEGQETVAGTGETRAGEEGVGVEEESGENSLEREGRTEKEKTHNEEEQMASAPPPHQVILRHYESFCRQRGLRRDAGKALGWTHARALQSEAETEKEVNTKKDEWGKNCRKKEFYINKHQEMTRAAPPEESHRSSVVASAAPCLSSLSSSPSSSSGPPALCSSSSFPSSVSSCCLCGSPPVSSPSPQGSSVSPFCAMVCDECTSDESEERGGKGKKTRKRGQQREGKRKGEQLVGRHSWSLVLREEQGHLPSVALCAEMFAAAFRGRSCWRPVCILNNSEGEKEAIARDRAERGRVLAALDLALRRLIHRMVTVCSGRREDGSKLPIQEWIKRKADYLEDCRRHLDRVCGGRSEKAVQAERPAEATEELGEQHPFCIELIERFRRACAADVEQRVPSASQ